MARLKSFTKAAAEIGVTPSAVTPYSKILGRKAWDQVAGQNHPQYLHHRSG
ncbi:LysR family transcriptional regulator [Klebsiella variicola subsp. variicola]|nr:LysR family transcriptional regulator [Klebsiella variicola subsp. variicola]